MALVVSGVSTLIHLYSVSYMASDRGYARFFAYLNFFVFSMLLLVLAGNFFFLIVGWAFVGAASYLLISFWYRRDDGDAGRHQGVRHQRGRRRRPRARHLLHLQADRHARLPAARSRPRRTISERQRRPRRGLPAAARRRVREVRAGAAAHLAPGRDGGPDAGLRAHPRRHDGHRGRLPDRAHAPVLRARARSPPTSARSSAASTLLIAATIGLVVTDLKRVIAYSTMSQIGYMVMGVSLGRLRRRPLPPDDARVLQGAALHGRRLGDRRDGGRAEPRQDGRLQARRCRSRSAAMAIGGLALAGVPPFAGFFSKDEILALLIARDDWHIVLGGARLRRRVHDRRLHVADDLPRVLRRAGRAGARARARPPLPRAGAHEPGDRRGRGHRRRLPRPRPPHRRARVEHEGRDGAARRRRDLRRRARRSRTSPTCCTTSSHPTFAGLELLRGRSSRPTGSRGAAWLVGAVLALGGIALAYALWSRTPSARRVTALRERLAGLYTLFVEQVVLRRDHRHDRRPAVRDVRPLRA